MVSKQKVATSSMWKMADSLVTKGASTIISVILARILVPDDYGIITLTAVFMNFTGILVQGGINTALVRKESVDELDYSSALFFSIVVATICYLSFFFTAPYIAAFYNNSMICPVIRIQMISLFIGAFGNVRNAIITREFRFRELCFINLFSTIAGGFIGIYLACNSFGVWALVLYALIRDALSVVILFIWVRWKPILKVSFKRLKELIGFSIWVLLSSVLDFWGNNISSLVLGKKYSMSDLGVYGKGGQFPELFCLHTFGALSSVLLPTMANVQHDKARLKHICRKMVSASAYVIFPMMAGLAVIGDKLIPFLYTEKWNGCIPILYFACISFGVNPFRSINMQLLYALGKSKTATMIEITRFIVLNSGILAIIFLFHKSIYWVSGVVAVVALITAILTQLATKKMIDYSVIEWIRDMLPHMGITLIMCIMVRLIGIILPLNVFFILIVQICVGVTVYWLLSLLFRIEMYYEIKGIIVSIINKRKTV